ncbi:MAG: hypothetical protein WD024_01415 [Bacillota bacterium]
MKTVKAPEVFRAMLTVDTVTRAVLLNRMAEVMGPVFGSYSQASAFVEERPMSSERGGVKP